MDGRRRRCRSPTKPPPRRERKIACPAGRGQLPVLCAGGRLDDIGIVKQNCIATSSANRKYNEKGQSFFGLHGVQPRRTRPFSRVRHGAQLPLRRKLPDCDTRTNQSRRVFLPRVHPKRRLTNLPKRCHPNQLHHFEIGGGIGSRGRTRGAVPECNGSKQLSPA